jgi:hypothetical protein
MFTSDISCIASPLSRFKVDLIGSDFFDDWMKTTGFLELHSLYLLRTTAAEGKIEFCNFGSIS